MRIAICEDNPEHAEILETMINKWSKIENKKTEVIRYRSAEEFMFHWPTSVHYDLAFLDIQMATMTGMELARYIRQQDKTILLVFTTGLKDYVLKGYEVRAYRYLFKPLKEKDIANTLNKAQSEIDSLKFDSVVIEIGTVTKRLNRKDIYYIEMDDHYIIIHTVDGDIRYKQKMRDIERLFVEPEFCKCHRSYIVNLYHTGKLSKCEVEIDNGDVLPVSKARWTDFNECFITYYMGKNDRW